MKKILLVILTFHFVNSLWAQCNLTYTATPFFQSCTDGSVIINISSGYVAGNTTLLFSCGFANICCPIATIDGLCPGRQGITVVTPDGCQVSDTINLIPADTLTVSLTTTPAYGDQDNGTATAHPSGGIPPYTYTWSDGDILSQTGSTATSLRPTTYWITVTDSTGCTAGGPSGFTSVSVNGPVITSLPATNITTTTVQLNGTDNPAETTDQINFYWGTDTTYSQTNAATPPNATGSSTVSASVTLYGLIDNTTYYYTAGVYDAFYHMYFYGNRLQFTTGTQSSSTPTITTLAANNITTSGAQLNGSVNANGGSDVVTFNYGTTTGYGQTISAVPYNIGGSTATGVTASVTGLTDNTTYYFQASVNCNGTTYNGNGLQFTTGSQSASSPTISTLAASNITISGGQLNALINANGGSDVVSFNWGTTGAYGQTASATPGTIGGSTATSASASLTGLADNTTFYFQASVDYNGTTYTGNEMQFTTGTAGIGQVAPVVAMVYPNPAHNSFTIEKPGDITYTMELTDMTGEKVLGRMVTDAKTNIDVSALADGIYLLMLKKDDAVQTYRIVVMNQ